MKAILILICLVSSSSFAHVDQDHSTAFGEVTCKTPSFACKVDAMQSPEDKIEGGKSCWCGTGKGPVVGYVLAHAPLAPNYVVCKGTVTCKVVPSTNETENNIGSACWCGTAFGPNAGKIIERVKGNKKTEYKKSIAEFQDLLYSGPPSVSVITR